MVDPEVVDGPATMFLAGEDESAKAEVTGIHARVKVACDKEIAVRSTLTARDLEGRKIGRYKAWIPMKAHHPNGPDCPPTCFAGSVRFNGATLVVA